MPTPLEDGTGARILDYTVDLIHELGHGSFGTVYKGVDPSGRVVALKKLPMGDRRSNRAARVEADRFQYLRDQVLQQNEHIVQVFDIKRYKDAMWIVMECCDFGNLNTYFREHHALLKAIRPKVNIMIQIINGISFLHQNHFVHRDIKPNNILVKRSTHAIIKLADFNLAKILNPEDSTSGMSSNVGTEAFKAPEFWNRKPPGNTIRYYRGVDVYAAALTFAAILQFQPGHSLTPRPEGSLQSTEANMPIGKVAFDRLVTRQTDVNVVQYFPGDCPTTLNTKRIISSMTHVQPHSRPTASRVESMFDEMFCDVKPTKCFGPVTIPTVATTTSISFANNLLVTRGVSSGSHIGVLNAIDGDTGEPLAAMTSSCDHQQTHTTTSRIDGNREAIFESCSECDRDIRACDIMRNRITALEFGEIKPGAMCGGPGNHGDGSGNHGNVLIVYDRVTRCILELVYHRRSLRSVRQIRAQSTPPLALCYNQQHGILVVLTARHVKGVLRETGHTVWKRRDLAGAWGAASGFGCVFVAGPSPATLTVLDAADGCTLKRLLGDQRLGTIRHVACSEHHNKLAVLHDQGQGQNQGQITCFTMKTSGV